MKEKAAEFRWWVPDFGFVLVSVQKPRLGPVVYHPALVYLRPAASVEDASQSLPAEKVTESLKAQLDAEGLGTAQQVEFGNMNFMANSEGCPGKLYRPLLKHTDLFRTFAAATPDAEGFVSFANQYGNLMDTCSVSVWHREVLAMRQAVHIWDLFRHEDQPTLAKHFKWRKLRYADSHDGSGVIRLLYDSHPDLPHGRQAPFPDRRTTAALSIYDPGLESVTRQQLKDDSLPCLYSPETFGYGPLVEGLAARSGDMDVFLAARFYLTRVINVRTDDHAASLFTLGEERTGRSRKSRSRLKRELHMSRVLVPRDLLGALWIQFEQSVAGNKEYRECPECGKSFEVSLTAARSDKKHCSNACRSKAYRERQDRAREMWCNGLSIKEIAGQLGAEQSKVEGWIAQRKEK